MRALAQVLLLLISAVLASPAHAQVLDGRLLDELTETPIPQALVFLLDAEGEVVARRSTDTAGVFVFRPDPGVYQLRVLASGYDAAHVPVVDLSEPGSAYPVDLLMTPRPLDLPGVDVVASRYRSDIERLGVRVEELGARLVTREAIEKNVAAKDVGEILERVSIPGITVARRENVSEMTGGSNLGIDAPAGTLELCVSMPRGRSFDGFNQCATWVLDGRVTTEEIVKLLDPRDIEAVVVLTPSEATLLYGTGSSGGAVAVYTRRGRAR